MKKKLFVLSAVLLASAQMICAGSEINVANRVFAEAAASDEYTPMGDGIQALEENGVTSCDLNGWGTGFYSKEKLALDGLAFDFYFDGKAVNGLGFTFEPNSPNGDLNACFHSPTVCFWDREALFGSGCAGQLGLFLNDNHNYAAPTTKIKVSPDAETDAFGYDKCIVAQNSETQNGIHVEYAKENDNWWSITITALDGMQSFAAFGGNPNLSGETVKVYISNTDMAACLDENGKTYLRVFDVNSGTNVYVKNLYNYERLNWTASNGDPTREKGVQAGNSCTVTGVSCGAVVSDKKVYLNGLEFDFTLDLPTGANYSAGLSFVQNKTYIGGSNSDKTQGTTISINRNAAGSGQDRITLLNGGIDFGWSNLPALNYKDMDVSSAKGFSDAGGIVANYSASTPAGGHFKIEKVDADWWKVTVTGPASYFWASNNYNLNADVDSVYTYINNADLTVDEFGAAYLAIQFRGPGDVETANISNIKNGKATEEAPATAAQINTVKDKINGLSFAGFTQEEVTAYEALRTAALAACDADGVKPSDINGAYNKLVEDIRKAHLATAFSTADTTYPEEADATANWNDRWGSGTKAIRLNNDGGIMMNGKADYGVRGKFADTYDITNFEISLDLSSMTAGNIGALSFNTVTADDECSYVSSDSGKLFSFDFYKYADGEYTITLSGATQDHNLSVDGFSNGTTHHPAYVGRIVNSFSNVFVIKVTTNYETGKTTITINDQEVELEATALFGATAPTAKIDGAICLGVFGTGSYDNIRVNYVKDAESIERATTIANNIASMDSKAAAVKATATAALTDETYTTYKAAFDAAKAEIEALVIATPANENAYLAKCAADKIAEMEAPITAYATTLANNKKDAVSALMAYFDEDKYDDVGYDECQTAILEGIRGINASTTLKGVEDKLAAGKAAIDAVITKAIKEARTAGVASIDAFANAIDNTKYTEANQTAIANLVSKAKEDINAATTTDAINTVIENAKTAINAIEVIPEEEPEEEGCGGSAAATGLLAGLLSLISLALLGLKKRK